MAETPKSVSVDSGETLVNYGETSRSPIFDMSLSCEELCSGQEPLLDREDEEQDRAPNECEDFTSTEKAPTEALSWLKAPTSLRL